MNDDTYAYDVVDVFTERRLEGNALAVLPDARGLDARTMQRIAREFNLAETAFVFPPRDAAHAAHVRIFTPTMEMQFAGHPTVGTAFVLRERQLVSPSATTFMLEEAIGDVPIRVERGEPHILWLTTPPIAFGPHHDRARCAQALGLEIGDLLSIEPQLVSAGNPCIFIALKDVETVDRAWLDGSGLRLLLGGEAGTPCTFVFTPTPKGAYARMFAPEHGVVEDPATGSATGPLAAYMMKHGLCVTAGGSRLISEQGVKMGRRSTLHILIRGDGGCDGIEIGGSSVLVARGELHLDRAD